LNRPPAILLFSPIRRLRDLTDLEATRPEEEAVVR
jgi:hypothetical protein